MATASLAAGLLNFGTTSSWPGAGQRYTRRVLASFKEEERIGQRVWREYGKALQKKDLKRALRILESVQMVEKWREQPSFLDLQQEQEGGNEDEEEEIIIPSPPQDLRNVLDTCVTATDMTLVARTYEFLQIRGLLPSFGKCKNITAEVSRDVTPAAFLEATGLEASKLSPKKWGLAGTPALLLVGSVVIFNVLVNNGLDIRPFLASILAFGVLDAVYLGGAGLSAILISWPPLKRRIFTHEAGHVLVAYLLGCPIRGVILDPVQAMRLGVQDNAYGAMPLGGSNPMYGNIGVQPGFQCAVGSYGMPGANNGITGFSQPDALNLNMAGRPGGNFGSGMPLLNAPAYDNLTPKGKPKDYKEGGQAVKFDTFHGTHDKLKALLFLQQFDAAFAGGNFTEA
ncbi:hypothetical protein L7F22_004227 [Adiantum nelumboides]|nr:hypothetical protein [Adiantum nelumboides]